MKLVHYNPNLARFNKEHAPEAPTAKQMAKAKQSADILAQQIRDKEEECLKTIHTRYCIINGLPIFIGDVSRYAPPMIKGKHNYYEYWHLYGTPKAEFLMSREMILKDGKYILQIMFNRSLARDGENAGDSL